MSFFLRKCFLIVFYLNKTTCQSSRAHITRTSWMLVGFFISFLSFFSIFFGSQGRNLFFFLIFLPLFFFKLQNLFVDNRFPQYRHTYQYIFRHPRTKKYRSVQWINNRLEGEWGEKKRGKERQINWSIMNQHRFHHLVGQIYTKNSGFGREELTRDCFVTIAEQEGHHRTSGSCEKRERETIETSYYLSFFLAWTITAVFPLFVNRGGHKHVTAILIRGEQSQDRAIYIIYIYIIVWTPLPN